MSPIEATASLLGLLNVVLVVRRSIWNYPFALAMVLLYAWVFFGEKLYSDALLQLFFFAVNLYGWWNWSRSRAETGAVRVEGLGAGARAGWALTAAVVAGLWGYAMHRFTDAAYPWWDGSIAVISIVAQILQSRRNWESWLLWILVDLLAIPLFLVKDLWLTAALYCVFLALSCWGLLDWLKARK